MRTIKAGAVAALIAATAGQANAAPNGLPLSGTSLSALVPNELKIGNLGGGAPAVWFGGTFLAWTTYRFFQNCGPFRCN